MVSHFFLRCWGGGGIMVAVVIYLICIAMVQRSYGHGTWSSCGGCCRHIGKKGSFLPTGLKVYIRGWQPFRCGRPNERSLLWRQVAPADLTTAPSAAVLPTQPLVYLSLQGPPAIGLLPASWHMHGWPRNCHWYPGFTGWLKTLVSYRLLMPSLHNYHYYLFVLCSILGSRPRWRLSCVGHCLNKVTVWLSWKCWCGQ